MTAAHASAAAPASALDAARNAAAASAELLRFVAEGPASPLFAFEEDAVWHLARALQATIALELPHLPALAQAFGENPALAEALHAASAALAVLIEQSK